MNQISVRVARPHEYNRLTDLYRTWGYRATVSAEDIVYVAEQSDEIVGLVRRTHEHATTMLRGMYVDPLNQRQGVGTQLLNGFVAGLADTECFCIPFAHLIAFYGGGGFSVVADEVAPPFLGNRAAKYRQDGRDVVIMRRNCPRGHPEGTGA